MDWKSVKIELTQGKTHADELKELLEYPKFMSSREACGFFLEKVIDSYDNALALLNDVMITNSLGSRNSVEDSFKDHEVRVSKRRKTNPAKWKEHVRICSEAGFDDGYNWRKYGQKKILKATHPRAYYRCTHRHTQGCLATKQVQREDDNPSNLQVVYIGKHTCIQETLKQSHEQKPDPQMKDEQPSPVNHIDDVKTKEYNKFPSFSFHVTPNDDFLRTNYSSPFETSDSYFSIGLQSSESDFAEIISSPTRVENFVFEDIDTQFLDASGTLW